MSISAFLFFFFFFNFQNFHFSSYKDIFVLFYHGVMTEQRLQTLLNFFKLLLPYFFYLNDPHKVNLSDFLKILCYSEIHDLYFGSAIHYKLQPNALWYTVTSNFFLNLLFQNFVIYKSYTCIHNISRWEIIKCEIFTKCHYQGVIQLRIWDSGTVVHVHVLYYRITQGQSYCLSVHVTIVQSINFKILLISPIFYPLLIQLRSIYGDNRGILATIPLCSVKKLKSFVTLEIFLNTAPYMGKKNNMLHLQQFSSDNLKQNFMRKLLSMSGLQAVLGN